jgi:hypothetical protein
VRCLSTILIIPIQQPEPSGGEAGGSLVRNGVWESLPTKHLTHAHALLHAVNLRHGTDGFTWPPKEVRATDFHHP